MTEPAAYVFTDRVTRVYEKQVIKAVHIRDKGGPNQHEEVETENIGWVLVVGAVGYLVPEKPGFVPGQEVEIVIRPKAKVEESK